jgi:hypothetical protein
MMNGDEYGADRSDERGQRDAQLQPARQSAAAVMFVRVMNFRTFHRGLLLACGLRLVDVCFAHARQ